MKTILLSALFLLSPAYAAVPDTISDPGVKEAVDYLDLKLTNVNNRIDSATGSLIGPTGPAGPQGVAGPTGPQGPQGIVGPEGPGTFNTTNYYYLSGGLFEGDGFGNIRPLEYTTQYDSAWEYSDGNIVPRL